MEYFVSPDDFESQDELIEHIFEEIIRPQIENMVGQMDGETGELQGEAFVLGGRDQASAMEQMQRIQHYMQDEGLSLDYVLREMTDINVESRVERVVRGIQVNFLQFGEPKEEVPHVPSAEELREMFER